MGNPVYQIIKDRMAELKLEINDLARAIGCPVKYTKLLLEDERPFTENMALKIAGCLDMDAIIITQYAKRPKTDEFPSIHAPKWIEKSMPPIKSLLLQEYYVSPEKINHFRKAKTIEDIRRIRRELYPVRAQSIQSLWAFIEEIPMTNKAQTQKYSHRHNTPSDNE